MFDDNISNFILCGNTHTFDKFEYVVCMEITMHYCAQIGSRNIKICWLPVLSLEVHVSYTSRHFYKPTIVHNGSLWVGECSIIWANVDLDAPTVVVWDATVGAWKAGHIIATPSRTLNYVEVGYLQTGAEKYNFSSESDESCVIELLFVLSGEKLI